MSTSSFLRLRCFQSIGLLVGSILCLQLEDKSYKLCLHFHMNGITSYSFSGILFFHLTKYQDHHIALRPFWFLCFSKITSQAFSIQSLKSSFNDSLVCRVTGTWFNNNLLLGIQVASSVCLCQEHVLTAYSFSRYLFDKRMNCQPPMYQSASPQADSHAGGADREIN